MPSHTEAERAKRTKLVQFRNAVRKSGTVVSVSEGFDDKDKARVSFEETGKKKRGKNEIGPARVGSVEVTRELARRMKLGDKIEVVTETKVKHG